MWRFEVDTAHVILVLGICQFLSYMWDGGREPSRKMLLGNMAKYKDKRELGL